MLMPGAHPRDSYLIDLGYGLDIEILKSSPNHS